MSFGNCLGDTSLSSVLDYNNVHVFELESGDLAGGVLQINESSFGAKMHTLYSKEFGNRQFTLAEGQHSSIVFRSHNEYITFLQARVSKSRQTNSRLTKQSEYDVIAAGMAVGEGGWALSKPLKRLRFRLPTLDWIVHKTEEKNTLQLSKAEAISEHDLDVLYEMTNDDCTIRIFQEIELVHPDVSPTLVQPFIEIEFTLGCNISDAYKCSIYVAGLLSLVSGASVRPFDYVIYSSSREEFKRMQGEGKFESPLRMYVPHSNKIPDGKVPFGFIDCLSDCPTLLSFLAEALPIWMKRRTFQVKSECSWEYANIAMLQYFSEADQFDWKVPVKAGNWFDTIPDPNVPVNTISEKNRTQLIESVKNTAKTLGLSHLEGNLGQRFQSLGDETKADRTDRLIEELMPLCEALNIDNEELAKCAKKAQKYRGKAAHTIFRFEDEEHIKAAHNAASAIAALSVLLSLNDLLWQDHAESLWLQNHPLLLSFKKIF